MVPRGNETEDGEHQAQIGTPGMKIELRRERVLIDQQADKDHQASRKGAQGTDGGQSRCDGSPEVGLHVHHKLVVRHRRPTHKILALGPGAGRPARLEGIPRTY